MNAVVLAGGVRSGLEIPGSGLPRALWPFPSRPLISHVLSFLVKSGCERMAICANGKTRMIAAELSAGATPWEGLRYSEDPLPRGPAGCLRDLSEWAGSETILAIQGTASYDFDLQAMLADHVASGAAITVGARRCEDASGMLEPVGVYLIEPSTLELISPVGYQDIKEQFITKAIASGLAVGCHEVHGDVTLIHSPEHYVAALEEAIVRELGMKRDGYLPLASGGAVHETAYVSPDARLRGAVWVEEGAVVEAGAVLMGPVVVGPKARVGEDCVVRRAVLMRGSRMTAGACLESTVLGPDALQTGRILRITSSRSGRGAQKAWVRDGAVEAESFAAELAH